jgi:hypothetical protein
VRALALLTLGALSCSGELDLGHGGAERVARAAAGAAQGGGDGIAEAGAPGAARGGSAGAPGTDTAPVVELGRSSGSAKGLDQDATYIYWAAPSGHELLRTPKAGGQTLVLATTSEAGPWDVAVGGEFVYFTTSPSGTLSRVPIQGGAVEVLATDLSTPETLTLDSEGVIWAELNGGTVQRAAFDGSSRSELVSGLSLPGGLRVDGETLYYTDAGLGTVSRIPRLGGTPTIVARCGHAGAVAIASERVVYTCLGSEEAGYDDGSVRAVPDDVLVADLPEPNDVQAVNGRVYFSTRGSESNDYQGGVGEIDLDSGDVRVLAAGQWHVYALVVDASAVYFTVDAENSLRKVSR